MKFILFITIEIIFLGIPILAYNSITKEKTLSKIKVTLYITTSILVIYYLCFFLFDISLKGEISDLVVYVITYFIYSSIVFSALKIKNKWLKISAVFTGLIPIILFWIMGITVLPTVIFMMILEDSIFHEKILLKKNLEVREIMETGGRDDINFFHQHKFFKTFPFLPFEKELASFRHENCSISSSTNKYKIKELETGYQIQLFTDEVVLDTLIRK